MSIGIQSGQEIITLNKSEISRNFNGEGKNKIHTFIPAKHIEKCSIRDKHIKKEDKEF